MKGCKDKEKGLIQLSKEMASVILDSKWGDGVVNEIIGYLAENAYFEWDR